MAWGRPGDKPLSEPMVVRLPTYIYVTRPQSVKHYHVDRTVGPARDPAYLPSSTVAISLILFIISRNYFQHIRNGWQFISQTVIDWIIIYKITVTLITLRFVLGLCIHRVPWATWHLPRYITQTRHVRYESLANLYCITDPSITLNIANTWTPLNHVLVRGHLSWYKWYMDYSIVFTTHHNRFISVYTIERRIEEWYIHTLRDNILPSPIYTDEYIIHKTNFHTISVDPRAPTTSYRPTTHNWNHQINTFHFG